jgi:DNA-binding LacI/PurR family transcriptional regulator
MQLCVRRLRGKGYRRMGFANRVLEDERLNHQYKAAFLIEQERCKRSEKVPPFIPTVWDKKSFLAWFRRYRPEVVISPDVEVDPWLRSMNLTVPGEVGFANLDIRDSSAHYSGIRQSHLQVGVVAMDLLISLIQRNERGLPSNPHLTLVEGHWVDGETTR